MGLISDAEALAIPPDYHLSLEQVYTSVAKKLIDHTRGLSVLRTVEYRRTDVARSIPSWAPDWTEETSRVGFSYDELTRSKSDTVYFSSGSSKAMCLPSEDDTKLVLRAVLFDKVSCVEPEAAHTGNIGNPSEVALDGGAWSQLASTISQQGLYQPTGEQYEAAFARLRVRDRWPGLNRRLRKPPASMPVVGPNNGKRPLHLKRYAAKISDYTTNCRLFLTNSGYMGLGEYNVAKGDHIYLLMGGEVPFILRPEGEHFRLVGEAYVHGIMDGEGLLKLRKKTDNDSDVGDDAWLESLANRPFTLPFETIEVSIV